MKKKVKVVPIQIKGVTGYDVQVLNPEATVQDYLDGLNLLIEEGSLTRTRQQVAVCKGCEGCCGERIPLTSIDVFKLRQAVGEAADTLGQFLGKYGYVTVEGPVVDIALAGGLEGRCEFLNEQGCCRIYAFRPMVCQTFICCPSTRRAKQLRSAIVNSGEDELIRQWLTEVNEGKSKFFLHEGYDPEVNLEEWIDSNFPREAQTYEQVKLKEICSPELWTELTADRG